MRVQFNKVSTAVIERLRKAAKLAKDDDEPVDPKLAGVLAGVFEHWDSLWSDLPDDVASDLEDAVLAGTTKGLIEGNVHVSEAGMISAVNDQAQKWAANRAAELVGMKRVDGALIPRMRRFRLTTVVRIVDVFSWPRRSHPTRERVSKSGVLL